MCDQPKPDGMKLCRLDTFVFERPKCPSCQSVNLKRYRSINQGDNSRLVWMRCQEPSCGRRFKAVME